MHTERLLSKAQGVSLCAVQHKIKSKENSVPVKKQNLDLENLPLLSNFSARI